MTNSSKFKAIPKDLNSLDFNEIGQNLKMHFIQISPLHNI